MDQRARDRLRDAGLPETPMYRLRELRRIAQEEDREIARAERRPRPSGPRAQAEPDQVVRTTERGADGKYVGRKAGAIATTLAPKEVWSAKQGRDVTKPTLKGSTWQLDLIDFRSLGAVSGYAMVAIDVGTRKIYAAKMADKSVDSLIAAFSEITADLGPESVNAPSLIDTDQERGWSTPEWEQYLEDKGIQQRYKVDKFAPNSLGMVDNAIARLKRYIRRRLTEEDLDADSWDQFLDEAVEAANGRKQEVLYRQSADDLYQNDGEPVDENAEHTIFALEQEQAEKLAKNRARHQRQKTTLQTQGAFRIPETIGFVRRNVLQASHSGEVHQVAGFEGTRVISARDQKAYPVSTVVPVGRNAMDVRLPPRLQRPGRLDKPEQRRILKPFVRDGRNFLAPQPDREAPLADFDAALRTVPGYAEALQRAGFRSPAGVPLRATLKFVQLFGDFGLTDRERTVFLRDGGDTSEDDQMRPTIQQEYDQAVEEVRDFDEYYDDDEEYQRAVEEVRAFPEFDEF